VVTAPSADDQRQAEIWHLDRSGRWHSIAIPGSPFERFENVAAAAEDGAAYFAGWLDGRLQLIKIAANGAVSFVRPLGIHSARLTGLIPFSERGVLLFGGSDRGAFAAKVDDSGLRLWTIDIDEHPRVAAFTRASLEEDGSCLLTVDIHDRREDGIISAVDRILLITVDSRGRITRSRALPIEPGAELVADGALGAR